MPASSLPKTPYEGTVDLECTKRLKMRKSLAEFKWAKDLKR
jgi:hypothetical protein